MPDVGRRWAVRRLAADQEAEFEAYVARDGGRLLGVAFLLTGNRHDAEDMVQTALLRCARQWSTARCYPEGYARTTLTNLARDSWRAVRRGAREQPLDDLPDRLPVAIDATFTLLDRDVLLRACRALPAQQRAVLALRFWEDRSVDETAAILGCSPGTVKTHTHRALGRLRALLDDVPGDVTCPGELERRDSSC